MNTLMSNLPTHRTINFFTLLIAALLPFSAFAEASIPDVDVEESIPVTLDVPTMLDVPASAATALSAPRPVVYQIPIRNMIEPSLVYIIRRGMREANAIGAAAVVFVMDTPGGRVDTTEEITRIIEAIKVPTYTFVEHNAISAGAIIALASDKIYMAPGSKIGDAMPVIASPQGGMQALGDAEREKVESYVDGLVRGIAQRKGRPQDLASAMVRRSVEFIIGDTVISKEGEILTLTHFEAERIFEIDGVERHLLSEGTVESVAVMLEKAGLGGAEIRELEITNVERIARFIAIIAPVLLTIGMLALWVEFQTPGIGYGAMIGVVCLAIFFFGHHIAGLAGHEEFLLFALGVILLMVEIFALPGFGLIGLTGVFLIMWSLLTSMAPTMPDGPMIPSLPELKIPIRNMVLSFLMSGIGMLLLSRYLPKSRATSWLVLQEATASKDGYTSADERPDLVGQTGRTVTPLRPGGSALIGDKRHDVLTRNAFVEAGMNVTVVEVHGNRIVVEPTTAAEESA